MHCTQLEHLPYSSDLSLCDFHLFRLLKEVLGAQLFEDDEGVKEYVRNWLLTQPVSFYNDRIKNLPAHWQKCIVKAGNYVKK